MHETLVALHSLLITHTHTQDQQQERDQHWEVRFYTYLWCAIIVDCVLARVLSLWFIGHLTSSVILCSRWKSVWSSAKVLQWIWLKKISKYVAAITCFNVGMLLHLYLSTLGMYCHTQTQNCWFCCQVSCNDCVKACVYMWRTLWHSQAATSTSWPTSSSKTEANG